MEKGEKPKILLQTTIGLSTFLQNNLPTTSPNTKVLALRI